MKDLGKTGMTIMKVANHRILEEVVTLDEP